ncbi:uncharacterized protein LOC125238871 isoform X2 [Leguminivora glycinivorella]|uniref:uncharacterized protein LOC125238871 isoform X2 n=1 Tax=Leguminivora glycinivorella TaxID=1035111 RepID=UPI00200E2188|nr:uncharacterized protein LOC125238871 isoform X2 [Leguminivora glycinivorella]
MRAAFFFLILASGAMAKETGFMPVLEEKFAEILSDYIGYVTSWFQNFNDEHVRKTEMGRFLNYDEMKKKLADAENHSAEGRSGMKKIGNTMMPLVFHVGAASTWMLLTTLLTAKTLAVGLALLVFKIAAGSAKLASFFTQLKHSKEDHHGYSSAWTPHYEHHDYHIEHHPDHHGN